jgi:hypothetical protein
MKTKALLLLLVFIFSLIGIPSAVLCFIAYKRMKKV